MKYKFKESELKQIVTEEIRRFISFKEDEGYEQVEQPLKYVVVALANGGTTPIAEMRTSDIEEAVEEAQEWTEKGWTLDPEQTSQEVLQQMGQEPTMPEEPGTPSSEDDPALHQVGSFMEDAPAEAKSKRPKKEEFLKQTYEIMKQQMPELSYEDFMKIEVPGGMSGRVNVLFYYYQTIDMPDKVAQILMKGKQKQEDMLEENIPTLAGGTVNPSDSDEEHEQPIDMTGQICQQCKQGTYQETSQMDDMDGVLHCNKCRAEVPRWQQLGR